MNLNQKPKLTRRSLLCILFLFGAASLLILLTLPSGSMYGSQTDWYCQHVTLADYMRKHFYATGQLLPDFSGLGGGTNFFALSYYGMLRPDVLLSYFLPDISVAAIIQGYAVFEIFLGIFLLYYWLYKKGLTDTSCFCAGFLYLCANCLFQAHRQIMFVNYLPFVILALIAIDQQAESMINSFPQKTRTNMGIVFSYLMILFHSFYFFPACFASCTLYYWFSTQSLCKVYSKVPRRFIKLWSGYILSTAAAVCLSMAVLLPTGLAILENKKDVAPTPLYKILTVNPTMDSLLYSVYGCGLTLICLYTVLLSIRRKSTRSFACILLCFLFFNIFYWILNGTLYVRPKSLIPFMPLILYLTALTLEELKARRIRHSLPLALFCLIPVIVQILFVSHDNQFKILMALDGLCLVLFSASGSICNKRKLLAQGLAFLLILVLPAKIYLNKSGREEYVSATDDSRSTFSDSQILKLCKDSQARMDTLERPYTNSNYMVWGTQNRSSIYSSVSNSTYNQFYYDTLRNSISNRNRVAVTMHSNPFQEYLMGVRYIQTTKEQLPAGYRIKAEKNGHVLAENDQVLPLAYGSTSLISEASFDRLTYPQNLDTLVNRTIVPDSVASNSSAYQSQMKPYALPENFFARKSTKKQISSTRKLPKNISASQLLLVSFDVVYDGASDISVSINGIKNCLSGSNAPYPNQNNTFTYMLSSEKGLSNLDLVFSKGNYKITNITAYTLPLSTFHHPGIVTFHNQGTKGSELLKGTISMDQDGYFVTSFAYAKGYQAFIDGKEIPVQTVNKAFAGFPLKKGAHEIQLKFHAPGKRAGLLISLIASCGLLFESLAYSILAIRHKKRILHRIRVVTFTDPISGKSRAFIKTNSPRISRADFKMNGGNPSLTGKSD